MRRLFTAILLSGALFSSCDDDDDKKAPDEDPSAFVEIDEIQLTGGATAAEISAYDPLTKRLFVVNAVKAAIDVINMEDPAALVYEDEISIDGYGGGVNSVAIRNGLLAAAIEADPKTDPGKVVVWSTADMSEKAAVTVGALPDMVTFSANGKYIVSANEGEPSEDYSIDPNGSVSIIDVQSGFSVTTLDFTAFNNASSTLMSKGYRIVGTDVDLAHDTEPEYVSITEDSQTAFVTLQENNAIARISLQSKTIEEIFPLGFKNYNTQGNELDPSDRDNAVTFATYPVYGVYMPDAITVFKQGATSYMITANEGDSRIRPTSDAALPPAEEGDLFNEEDRVKDVDLDGTAFPNAATLQGDAQIGRLKITNTMGDTDGDGDYDALYAFGARSFSIWNGTSGELVFDSGSKLEKFVMDKMASAYDDTRSDDKGVEPEGVATGIIGDRILAFVGLERADAIVVVDVTNPSAPQFLQVLSTGDAPEGVHFIPYDESPNGRSLLVVSSEGDGKVKVYQAGAK